MRSAERWAAELGLRAAVVDDGEPDPWAVNIAMAIVCLGVTFGAVFTDSLGLAVVMVMFALAFAVLGGVLRDG